KGGYGQLIKYLYDCSCMSNSEFHFNTIAEKIVYKKHVIVHTADKRKFEADKLIITVSAGVLQSGSIQFDPPLKDHALAIQGLGFGGVIKFLLEFRNKLWKKYEDRKST